MKECNALKAVSTRLKNNRENPEFESGLVISNTKANKN